MQIKLKQISLGNIDAKNEVINNTPEEIQRFLKSFVCPPALSIEKFMGRQKYYIVGLKGTGKTALLRYISLKLEEDENAASNFVLFKGEVDEDLKKDFSKAARVHLAEETPMILRATTLNSCGGGSYIVRSPLLSMTMTLNISKGTLI